jgi:hypothetical protein
MLQREMRKAAVLLKKKRAQKKDMDTRHEQAVSALNGEIGDRKEILLQMQRKLLQRQVRTQREKVAEAEKIESQLVKSTKRLRELQKSGMVNNTTGGDNALNHVRQLKLQLQQSGGVEKCKARLEAMEDDYLKACAPVVESVRIAAEQKSRGVPILKPSKPPVSERQWDMRSKPLRVERGTAVTSVQVRNVKSQCHER